MKETSRRYGHSLKKGIIRRDEDDWDLKNNESPRRQPQPDHKDHGCGQILIFVINAGIKIPKADVKQT